MDLQRWELLFFFALFGKQFVKVRRNHGVQFIQAVILPAQIQPAKQAFERSRVSIFGVGRGFWNGFGFGIASVTENFRFVFVEQGQDKLRCAVLRACAHEGNGFAVQPARSLHALAYQI